uniref:BAP29/BAP31 transmembrane domain-containing protein n=1 Tax=Palpitomonas bilix TaxID=652834 RepID=A0A7S3D214_9EUKA
MFNSLLFYNSFVWSLVNVLLCAEALVLFPFIAPLPRDVSKGLIVMVTQLPVFRSIRTKIFVKTSMVVLLVCIIDGLRVLHRHLQLEPEVSSWDLFMNDIASLTSDALVFSQHAHAGSADSAGSSSRRGSDSGGGGGEGGSGMDSGDHYLFGGDAETSNRKMKEALMKAEYFWALSSVVYGIVALVGLSVVRHLFVTHRELHAVHENCVDLAESARVSKAASASETKARGRVEEALQEVRKSFDVEKERRSARERDLEMVKMQAKAGEREVLRLVEEVEMYRKGLKEKDEHIKKLDLEVRFLRRQSEVHEREYLKMMSTQLKSEKSKGKEKEKMAEKEKGKDKEKGRDKEKEKEKGKEKEREKDVRSRRGSSEPEVYEDAMREEEKGRQETAAHAGVPLHVEREGEGGEGASADEDRVKKEQQQMISMVTRSRSLSSTDGGGGSSEEGRQQEGIGGGSGGGEEEIERKSEQQALVDALAWKSPPLSPQRRPQKATDLDNPLSWNPF